MSKKSTRWWTGKQAPPPRPPSPVSAKILRISGRGNCKEAATWAAPRSGKAGPADFEGRALRGWRFANVVCEPKPRPGGLRERFSATRGVRIEDSPPRTRGRPKDGHGRKARPGRRYEGAAAPSCIPRVIGRLFCQPENAAGKNPAALFLCFFPGGWGNQH